MWSQKVHPLHQPAPLSQARQELPVLSAQVTWREYLSHKSHCHTKQGERALQDLTLTLPVAMMTRTPLFIASFRAFAVFCVIILLLLRSVPASYRRRQSRHLNSCENDEHAKLMTERMTLERTRTSRISHQFKTNLSNQLKSNYTSNIENDNYGSLCS